jgi:hypothetical protein
MAATRTQMPPTGGYPGFRFWNELGLMYTNGLQGQVDSLSRLWSTLQGNSKDKASEALGDLAQLMQRSFNLMEDLFFLPFRTFERDRPAWASLVWDKKVAADAPNDTIDLTRRLVYGAKVYHTPLQGMGGGGSIPASAISVEPDSTGAKLQLTIDGKALKGLPPGSYVGVAYTASQDPPIAVIMLTITD